MDFSASPGDGEATLQWADPQDADIDRYGVRHGPSLTALGQWFGIPESGASTVRHTVTELANGERHHFELRAVTEVGSGEALEPIATKRRSGCRQPAMLATNNIDGVFG